MYELNEDKKVVLIDIILVNEPAFIRNALKITND